MTTAVTGAQRLRRRHLPIHRVLGVAVAVAAAGGLLAGCGGTAANSGTTALPPDARAAPVASQQHHNQADVVFLQNMIPHHAQAISMSQLAHAKTTSLKVKALAVRIKAAQEHQIPQMRDLLTAWDAAVPQNGKGGGQMPGMLSDQQMQQLTASSGDEFDQMFLQMMVSHHQGAIQMSQTELAQGSDPQARRLAQEIISGQQVEINQMQKLLRPS